MHRFENRNFTNNPELNQVLEQRQNLRDRNKRIKDLQRRLKDLKDISLGQRITNKWNPEEDRDRQKLIKSYEVELAELQKPEKQETGSTGLKQPDDTAPSDEKLREIIAKWGDLAHEGLDQIKPYQPLPTLMNKPAGDKAAQDYMKELDRKIRIENEATAWSRQDSFRQMQESFRIFDSEEFYKIWDLALKAEESNEQLETLKIAAKHFGTLDQNAQSLKEAASQRFQEVNAHHETIQNLDINKAKSWLNKMVSYDSGNLGDFQKAALQRATDLKSFREDVNAHQQTTKKIIDGQQMISKTSQHLKEYKNTLKDLEKKCTASEEYTKSKYKQNEKKIGEWETRIEANKLTGEILERVAEAEERAKSYREMANAADERANKYEEIAKAAEKRAERAKSLGLAASDAETTAKSARKIVECESKLSEYAEKAAIQAEILKDTTISDSDKNSAFAAESAAINVAEHCLKSTKNHLDSQVRSLLREISATQSLKGSCEQEKKALEQLVTKLEAFEFLLEEVEKKETNAADATDKIKETINTKGVTSQQIQDAKNEQIGFIDEARKAEEEIKNTLKDIIDYEKQVFGALKRQIAHTNLENPNYQQQAVKKLQELRINNISEKEKKKARGFEFDIGAARVSLPDGKGGTVWTEVRKINKWIPIDENTTRIEYRPDIVEIEIEALTREAKTVTMKPIYAKRLNKYVFSSDLYDYELEILGDSFTDGGRRMGKLTQINKDKRDAKNPDGTPKYREDEWKLEKYIDMVACKTLTIKEYHVAQNKQTEVRFDYHIETMPSPIIDHRKALRKSNFKYRENVAFFNLDARNADGSNGKVEGSNGKDIPFTDVDWTESSKTGDLVLRLQGAPEVSHIRLDTALSKGTISQHEKDAKKLIDRYLEQSIKDLEKILSNTSDTTKIQEAFLQAKRMKRLARLTADELKRIFYSVPHDRMQIETFQQEKSQKIPFIFKNLNDYLDKVDEMQKAGTNIDAKLYKDVKDTLSLNNPFYPATLHKRRMTREKWFNAEHLDQVFDSGLLDNPLMAGTFVMEIAEDAGKAAYTIEHIKTQSEKLANVAQRKVEDEIFNEVNQAILTYNDKREAASLEALRVSVSKCCYNAALLREKANAAQASQEFAQLIGDIPDNTDRFAAKTAFITKAKDDCAKKSGDEMLNSILKTAKVAIEIRLRGQGVNDHVNFITTYTPVIDEIQRAARDAMHAGDDIFTQKLNAVTAARNEAIRQLGGEQIGEDRFQAAKKSSFATGTQIENEVLSLQSDIDEAENDAKNLWHKENNYGITLAKNTLQKMEEEIESTQKQARLADEDPEAAGAKTARHMATVEIEKLEAARARIDASKPNDVRAQIAAYKDAMDVQYTADSVYKQDLPGSAPRGGHLWIDHQTGQIMQHDDIPLGGWCMQDIRSYGDAVVQGQVGNRDTHTGFIFQTRNGVQYSWNMDHAHLAVEDDRWKTRTRIYLKEPDGQGGHRDMLYLPNDMGIELDWIAITTLDHMNGVTITLDNVNAVPPHLRGCSFNLAQADRRGHLRINEETGQITLGRNDDPAHVYTYLQDIKSIGNAQGIYNQQGTRNHFTGIAFKKTLWNPTGGIGHGYRDVDHVYDLSDTHDDWTTRTYMHFLPDRQGGCVDMLHLADGTWLKVDHIDLTKTEYSSKDGITIVLREDLPDDLAHLRDRKFNLKRIAQAVHGNLTKVEQHEAAALLATREATKKRLWSQTEEDVLDAARTIADLQELSKTTPAGGGLSPYEIAINEAREEFTTFTNTARDKVENNLKRSAADTADGTRGQIDEKNVAWLEAAQRYAQEQKRIADATKKAVDAAEATAKAVGKDVKVARQRAEQVVRGLSKLARDSDIGRGGDGFAAAAIAAEEASDAEVLIAEKIQEAVKTAECAAQLAYKNNPAKQEEYVRAVAQDAEAFMIASRKKAQADSATESRKKAVHATMAYTDLGFPRVNVVTMLRRSNNRMNQLINSVVNSITPDMISNADAQEIVRDAAKAMAVSQWAMIEEAKLEGAIANQECARTAGTANDNYLEGVATHTVDNISRLSIAAGLEIDGITPKRPVEGAAAAAFIAKEHAVLLQAEAKAAKAEKAIVQLTGGTTAEQTRAVNEVLGIGIGVEGTIQAIYTKHGLVAAVRYAESRAQVADAIREAADAAEQVAQPANVNVDRRAAAIEVRDQSEAARVKNNGDRLAQDIESAEVAKRAAATRRGIPDAQAIGFAAGQTVKGAGAQAQMTLDLTGANHDVATPQTTERVDAAKQLAAHHIEITHYVTEADKSGGESGAKDVLEAFLWSKAAKQAYMAQKYITMKRGRNNTAQITAAKKAEQAVREQPDLVAAIRHAASLAQVAKSIESVPNITQMNAIQVDQAAQVQRNRNDIDSFTKDVEVAKAAEGFAATLRGVANNDVPTAQAAAGEAVIHGRIEYHEDIDEEYKYAIKEASEIQVDKTVKIIKISESLQKDTISAFNTVKDTASKASQDFIQGVEEARDVGLKNAVSMKTPHDFTQFYDSFLVDARNKAENIAIKKADLVTDGQDKATQRAAGQNGRNTVDRIALEAERMVLIRGGDRNAQRSAAIATVTAYLTSQTEIVSSAEAAGREAEASAILAGRDPIAAGRTARQDVLFAADIAQCAAALENKSQIDQYAAAAAGAAQSAAEQAEVTRLAQASAASAQDNASLELENVLQAGSKKEKAAAHAEIKTRSENAAGNVIDKFIARRETAANAKIDQAEVDIAILAQETEAMTGQAGLRNQALERMRKAVRDTRADLQTISNSPAAIAEAVAQVAATQLTIVQAQRDIAKSMKVVLEAQGIMPVVNQRPLITTEIINVYTMVMQEGDRVQLGHGIVGIHSAAGETAIHLATQWRAIAVGTKAANKVEYLQGNVAQQILAARTTERSISQLALHVTARERVNLGATAYKLAAEVATQQAEVENARLTAALARHRIAVRAGIPAIVGPGGGPTIATEVGIAVGNVDAAIQNAGQNLPTHNPGGYDDLVLATPFAAHYALRVATIEVKLKQAVERSVQSLGYVANAANTHLLGGAPRNNVVNPIKERIAQNILNAANQEITNGGSPEDALVAVLRGAEANAKIEAYTKEIEQHARYYARIANLNADQEARNAIQDMFNELQGINPANQDQPLEAVALAKKYAASYEQIKKAIERLVENEAGATLAAKEANAQVRAQLILNIIRIQPLPLNTDRVIFPTQITAGTVEKSIRGVLLNNNSPEANLKAAEVGTEIQDAIDKVRGPDTLDGKAAIARKAEIARILDNVEAISRNGEVARSLDVAAGSAGAIASMLGDDEAAATDGARQSVRRAAITGRTIAKALYMDDQAQIAAESKYAASTAARYTARHAIALAEYERTAGRPVLDQRNCVGQVLQDYDQFMRDDARASQRTFIDQGKDAIRQYLSHKSYDDQNAVVQAFEQEFLKEANETRRIIADEGGDEIEQELAIAAVAEHLAATEHTKKDLVFAARKNVELTDGDMDAEASNTIQEVEKARKYGMKNAKKKGMSRPIQIAAGAAEAAKFAETRKNEENSILSIKGIASLLSSNKTEHTTNYKEITKKLQRNAKTFKINLNKKNSLVYYNAIMEKYTMLAEKIAEDSLEPIPPKRNEFIEKSRRELIKSGSDTKNKAILARKDIATQHAEAVAALRRTLIIQREIDTLQYSRIRGIPPRPQATLGVMGIINQAQLDQYDQHVQNIVDKAKEDVLNIMKNVAQTDDVIAYNAEVSAAVTRYVVSERGENEGDQNAAGVNAKQEVLDAAADMKHTIIASRSHSVALLAAASSARFREIHQAIKGLSPENVKKVLDASEAAFTAGKDFIAKNAEAAEAAVGKACELKGNLQGKANAGKKAKHNVEAAVASTQANIAKAGEGTTEQTALADKVARYATSQAEIAQTFKVLEAYINDPTLAAGFGGLMPAVFNAFRVPGAGQLAPAVAEALTKNLMDLVAATRDNAPANADPVAVREKMATIATTYVENLLDRDAQGNIIPTVNPATGRRTHGPLARNLRAFTEAKGIAAISKGYASKAAGTDRQIEEAGATSSAHLLHISKEATITMAENMAANNAMRASREASVGVLEENFAVSEAKKEIKEIATNKEAEAKSAGEQEEQQATAVIETVAKAPASGGAVAREVKRTADTVQAGAQALGLDGKQMKSQFAGEVRNAARDKQREQLENFKSETVREMRRLLQEEARQAQTVYPNSHGTIQRLLNEALPRIEAAATKALDEAAAKHKDITTQDAEAIAAARAQKEIEIAKIQIVASQEEASIVAAPQVAPLNGWGPRTRGQIDNLLRMVDRLVQNEKKHAGTDVVQQYTAVAASAKKMASSRVQFHQVIIQVASTGQQNARANARNIYNNAERKLRAMNVIGPDNLVHKEILLLSSAKWDAHLLANPGALLAAPVRPALQEAEQAGETTAQEMRDQIKTLRNRANEAYRDGAKQQGELGQFFGETLKAITEPVQNVADAIGAKPEEYAKFFSGLVMELYEQAKEETRANPNLNLEQRIQAQTKVLTQAREMVVKLAKAMEDTAKATQAYKLAALAGEDTAKAAAYEEAKKVFDIVNKKRTDTKVAHGDLSTQIAADIDTATQVAACAVVVQKAIQGLTTQVRKDLDRLNITKEQRDQIVMQVANEALDEIHQKQADAKVQGHDIGSKELTVITGRVGMEILFRVRTDTTLSTQAFDKTLKDVVQKIEDEVSAPSTQSELKLDPLQFFKKYERYLKDPNPSLADQARLKKIEAFFEKKDNGVHDYWQNQYYLKRAIQAAEGGHFHHDNSAGHYIARMKIVPEPDRTSTKPEDLRQGFEHDWVSFLNETLQQSLRPGGSDELIGDALAAVDIQMHKRHKNIKPVVGEMESKQEILKALDDMDTAEVPSPIIDPGEEVTDPRAAMRRRGQERLDQNYTLKELEARTPRERALDNQALNEFFVDSSMLAYEGLLERADPELRASLKENAVKILTEMNQRMLEDYKREDAKNYEIKKMMFYRKEADRQFWRGLMKDWALLWLRNTINDGSKAEKDAMDQIWKLITKALG